ncbi:unnamed protein product [Rotaria magnacalcarata]|uniref:F-box domain-containing protein n=1 Tax=Rotaria magnacalcarata TaxID=392030 RepID=A0A814R6Z2_9BILA|nr:unnamed protein product [Rotaria magnacalcarata]CAF2156280.1 unnamed protein product [Rotaria magnacalcarata]CAF3842772.1 unnamed protein product [Rotaria magnacalcarata]CAF3852680.1 unnamed protein product [Rotaria magnacalcarata]
MQNNEKVITHLLELPNELFPYLLNYLSSAEILKAFLELSERNTRLASLIIPYLSYINLSHESNFWLTTRLPKFRDVIYSVCATTRQLTHLRDLPSLGTLTIVEIHSTNDLAVALRTLTAGVPKLYSLKLKFILKHDIFDLESSFDIPLEEFDLSLRCSFIPTGSMIYSLRHLTLRVNAIGDLFQLGRQLPMIESLFININRQIYTTVYSLQQFDSFVILSPYIKRVGLYSRDIIPNRFRPKYRYEFEYFEKFIHGCSSSLEYLTLDLILPNRFESTSLFHSPAFVDGDRLEKEIIAVLPRLKKFEFCIEFELPVKCIEKYQSSFATELWRQRCIVIDYPISATLPVSGTTKMIVFSITDTGTVFEELSIASSRITNWHSNTNLTTYHNGIILTSVRTITIVPLDRDTTLTLDLFQWISASFPRLRCLELVQETDWQLEEESVSYPELENVRVLCFRGQFSSQLIRRLLRMCPRLRYLELSKASLTKMITDSELYNDPYLINIYHQILEIQLTGSDDYVNFNGQLHDFFPLAYFL